jgi:hypothetical protein
MIEVASAPLTDRLYARRRRLESLVRAEYERCHPQESFEDLKHRARFSKEDKGLLRDWLEVAERRDRCAGRASDASVGSSEGPGAKW